MIERRWDGIAVYYRPENKVLLGFVKGVNNKIRVIQRRAYGLHQRLKVCTCMRSELGNSAVKFQTGRSTTLEAWRKCCRQIQRRHFEERIGCLNVARNRNT